MSPEDVKGRLASLKGRLEGLEFNEETTPVRRVQIAATLDAMGVEAARDIVPRLAGSDDPDLKDDAARLFWRMAQVNTWLEGREDYSKTWIDRAADAAVTDVVKDLVENDQRRLRDSESLAGVQELRQAGLVEKAYRLVASRLRRTRDPVARKRLKEVLADPRHFAAPITSAPGLSTYNGIGMVLYGERARASDMTYVATQFFAVLFIPLLPLKSFLVLRQPDGWMFLARVPLSGFCFWWRRLIVTVPVVAGLCLWGFNAWASSPSVRDHQKLASIEAKREKGLYSMAIGELWHANITDPGRAERRDKLARSVLRDYAAGIVDAASADAFANGAARLRDDKRGWVDAAAVAEVERAIDRLGGKGAGRSIARLLGWMASQSMEKRPNLADVARRACGSTDDPGLLAAAIECHLGTGAACPPELCTRLRAHLDKGRHAEWADDAISYLRAADPREAAPILDLRAKDAWTGVVADPGLLRIESLPAGLRKLVVADAEPALEQRLPHLEAATDPGDLVAPRRDWHRLGVARRLALVCSGLNEVDPVKHPLAKAVPWAVLAVELDPGDLKSRRLAVRGLLAQGDAERADALASPALHDLTIGLLGGVARARLGKLESAADILRPLVEREFPRYTSAASAYQRTLKVRVGQLYDRLQRGTADQGFIRTLNSLPQEKAQAMADAWVERQIRADPDLQRLRKETDALFEVQAAAQELAMIELELGRTAGSKEVRAERLQAAERLFRELSEVSPDDADQEMKLAQVCAWIGKQAEAAAIFERLKTSPDPDLLAKLAEVLREVGKFDEARAVYESAYEKAEGDRKRDIAHSRATTAVTQDDRLTWLRRSHASHPTVAMEIAATEANLAMEAGRYQDAVAPLERVAAHYAGQAETAPLANNASINRRYLAVATGETSHLREALALQKRAHELAPQESIILGNYIDLLEDAGAASIAGTTLKLDILREVPTPSWLEWIQPPLSREELAGRVKPQPEMRLAAELSARLAVLMPDHPQGYVTRMRFYSLTADGAAMRRLREALEAAAPAFSNQAARDEARGVFSEESRAGTVRLLAAGRARVERARKGGHAPSLAYSLSSLATARRVAFRRKVEGGDLAVAIREAEEAVKTLDHTVPRRVLALLRMDAAAFAVAESTPEFAPWITENPGVAPGALLALYLRRRPSEAVAKRDDVKAASEALAACGSDPWPAAWVWLEAVGHPAKAAARESIRRDPTILEAARIEMLVEPESVANVVHAWMAAEATGETGLRNSIEAKANSAGLVQLFFRR